MSRFRAGIRRGVTEGDQFTQIANGPFRDGRLSFKTKGLFGLLPTHREGWRMSVTDLARCGREGESAAKSGLKELEQHGFLVRERERGQAGTLGAAVYFITDLPALQSRRSQPESGFPPADKPTLVDRPTKKTNKQRTRSLRPCDHSAIAGVTSGTGRPDAAAPPADSSPAAPSAPDASPVPPVDEMHPGIRLLLELAATRPELLLTGKTLTDQGRVVTVMPESGWTSARLRHVIAGRPPPADPGAYQRRRDHRRPPARRPGLPTTRHRRRPAPSGRRPGRRTARFLDTRAVVHGVRGPHGHRSPDPPRATGRTRRLRRPRRRPRRRPLPGLPRLAAVPHLPRPHTSPRPLPRRRTLHHLHHDLHHPTEGNTP